MGLSGQRLLDYEGQEAHELGGVPELLACRNTPQGVHHFRI
jgi:hypothetical protein